MIIKNNQDRKWEILGSEYLIKRPWLTARKDHVRMPSGVENEEYYVLEYPDWVNVIAITDDGFFLMERQYRHGIQQTCYELCAGVCEKGETPLQAAQRELYEETGFGGGEWSLFMGVCPNPSSMTNTCYCFLALHVKQISTQHLEATEDISVQKLSLEEVRYLLNSNQFKQALMVAPLWKYMTML